MISHCLRQIGRECKLGKELIASHQVDSLAAQETVRIEVAVKGVDLCVSAFEFQPLSENLLAGESETIIGSNPRPLIVLKSDEINNPQLGRVYFNCLPQGLSACLQRVVGGYGRPLADLLSEKEVVIV